MCSIFITTVFVYSAPIFLWTFKQILRFLTYFHRSPPRLLWKYVKNLRICLKVHKNIGALYTKTYVGLLLFAGCISRDSVFCATLSVFVLLPPCWVVWHCLFGQDTYLWLSAFRNTTLLSKLSTGFWLHGHEIRG